MDSVFFQTSLFSRASQCDGCNATVPDAPLPLHFIGGASVAHATFSTHIRRVMAPLSRQATYYKAQSHLEGFVIRTYPSRASLSSDYRAFASLVSAL
ncbi:hypothetical protein EVAR_57043_1 [Eumeta japonica]|uniref:Uncharacterized protein n=1 Tax=Eumeta variegata TaxID=151549 RepID=A0A4C1YND7_EUMVA|nr:hypothetical protein EVAR_57043_1 [Eumeta japonica]